MRIVRFRVILWCRIVYLVILWDLGPRTSHVLLYKSLFIGE